MTCQKVQTLTRRCVGDAAAGLGVHFLHMSQGPFSREAGHMSAKFWMEIIDLNVCIYELEIVIEKDT